MKEKLNALVHFLETGIWFVPESDLSGARRFFLRVLKVLLLAARGYGKDNLGIRVSALTFYTFLSVVPVVAVAFGISKGFGFDKSLQATLLAEFSQQRDILERVFQYANTMLQKTSGGIVAGAGVALLLWSIINLLGAVEEAFNTVWKVPEPRSIGRKAADYLSFALIGPVFFLMASSVTVTLTAQVKAIANTVAGWGIPPAPIFVVLRLIPFVLVWALFSFIFIGMPNTRVRWSAGIGAGILAGTAYQLVQWIYITFQVGVSKNNAIYGSLAAIPLFLAWVQISWTIVLMGSEISHAIQDLDTLGFPEKAEEVSPRHRKILAVLAVREIARRFREEKKRPTSTEIARVLNAPSSLVGRILLNLSDVGLVTAVKPGEKDEEPTWQPGRDIHQLTVASVLDALDRNGSIELEFPASDEFSAASGILDEFGRILDASPANRPILNL